MTMKYLAVFIDYSCDNVDNHTHIKLILHQHFSAYSNLSSIVITESHLYQDSKKTLFENVSSIMNLVKISRDFDGIFIVFVG